MQIEFLHRSIAMQSFLTKSFPGLAAKLMTIANKFEINV